MRCANFPITTLVLAVALQVSAIAQETQLGSDFRREAEELKKDCSSFTFSSVGSCLYTVFTDHPMHIAVGSLAPQNGFGFGPAFVAHLTPNESWRLSWDVDAVASSNASWRAGAYMTAVWDHHRRIVVKPGAGSGGKSNITIEEYPVFHVLAQSISLNTIDYFGIGPNTSDTSRSYFGMRETITGVNATFPILQRNWHISLYGEANGRFVDVRPSPGQSSPSIEQLYTPVTAPGLDHQPAYVQFGQGVRIRPEFAGGHVRLDYSSTFQEFVAAGDSTFSFQRWDTDFSHQFPLYNVTRRFTSAPNNFNGPDDCSVSTADHSCPAVTRNLEGSISIDLQINQSLTSSGHVVPFYFQPTLGGSDINGNPALPSYQDYRFRAPNNLLLRASFEHSIYGPVGFTAMVDEGKVALRRSDLDITHLRHSYSVGLTLRAGGFPLAWLLFSWGGREGTHTTAAMDTSLLGASARPSLY
jgi:hypothetical protein